MNKKKTALILSVITVVLAALGLIFLPDQVVVQISRGGEPGNVMPKAAEVIVAALISAVGIGLYLGGDGTKDTKNILLACVGFLVAGFTLVMNLFIL